MALTKESVEDKIEVLEDGCIQVRTATRVKEDDVVIAETFHRHVVVPGADYSGESDRVRSIAEQVHTAKVIAAYQANVNG